MTDRCVSRGEGTCPTPWFNALLTLMSFQCGSERPPGLATERQHRGGLKLAIPDADHCGTASDLQAVSVIAAVAALAPAGELVAHDSIVPRADASERAAAHDEHDREDGRDDDSREGKPLRDAPSTARAVGSKIRCMGADIYDWDRVHGKGSYATMADAQDKPRSEDKEPVKESDE